MIHRLSRILLLWPEVITITVGRRTSTRAAQAHNVVRTHLARFCWPLVLSCCITLARQARAPATLETQLCQECAAVVDRASRTRSARCCATLLPRDWRVASRRCVGRAPYSPYAAAIARLDKRTLGAASCGSRVWLRRLPSGARRPVGLYVVRCASACATCRLHAVTASTSVLMPVTYVHVRSTIW